MRGLYFSGCVLFASVAWSQFGSASHAQVSVGENPLIYLDQGWTSAQRRSWYAASQGSRLMPASWFRALEQADSQELFLDRDHMERFRFLFDDSNPLNPYPIGFAEDRNPDGNFDVTRLRWLPNQRNREAWIGLNCAACHTGQIEFDGQSVRVDGAPSIIDFQAFDEEIARALRRTLDDSSKFERFKAGVLGARGERRSASQRLRSALSDLVSWREHVVEANHTDRRYGFARLDAVGHILNQVSRFAGADSPTYQPADAPVSFPFLWNTPQHDLVQWNGLAANGSKALGIDYTALGRNAGEVIGVFGEVNVKKRSGYPVFGRRAASSIFVSNLIEMEDLVGRLESPQWPAQVLGDIDLEKVERGGELFEQKCSSCHKHLEHDDLQTPVIAQMSRFLPVEGEDNGFPPPETDPAMACRAFERTTASGFYKGSKFEDEAGTSRVIGDRAQNSTLLAAMVRSTLLDQAGELVTYVASPGRELVVHNPGDYVVSSTAFGANDRGDRISQETVAETIDGAFRSPVRTNEIFAASQDWGEFTTCMTTNPSRLKAYKARPLNGIWATAPYLHNGSVPNLYQLLLPPIERQRDFYTGSRRYDPKNVGYVSEPSDHNSFHFEAYDSSGRVLWGNYNGGHDYGNADLTDEERWALIEYMKSL